MRAKLGTFLLVFVMLKFTCDAGFADGHGHQPGTMSHSSLLGLLLVAAKPLVAVLTCAATPVEAPRLAVANRFPGLFHTKHVCTSALHGEGTTIADPNTSIFRRGTSHAAKPALRVSATGPPRRCALLSKMHQCDARRSIYHRPIRDPTHPQPPQVAVHRARARTSSMLSPGDLRVLASG